jgi:hypothetical protein
MSERNDRKSNQVDWSSFVVAPEAAALAGLASTADRAGPQQPSPFEQLVRIADVHATAEAESLAIYRELADSTHNPVVKLLLEMVLEEEERHHGLMRRIQATLHDGLRWTSSPEALPDADGVGTVEDEDARSTLKSLYHEEQLGAAQLRKLAHDNRDLSDGLVSALLEWIARDSEKHAAIMDYILKRQHISHPRAKAS